MFTPGGRPAGDDAGEGAERVEAVTGHEFVEMG